LDIPVIPCFKKGILVHILKKRKNFAFSGMRLAWEGILRAFEKKIRAC
jgi:hypothetical protein